MLTIPKARPLDYWILGLGSILVIAIYSLGLGGGWLFDDYPNIVDNPGIKLASATTPDLVRAALSSPASEFKRPLASLSFAANYLVSGLDPYTWKLTNLFIHLLNGLLVFVLTRGLLQAVRVEVHASRQVQANHTTPPRYAPGSTRVQSSIPEQQNPHRPIAALLAVAWMLLPINLTAVLYVVQRMESMANAFVLLGLIGYVTGRQCMLARQAQPSIHKGSLREGGFILCTASIIMATMLGLLAKETAVMLPLYALLTEWALFRFSKSKGEEGTVHRDLRIISLFMLVLMLPMIIGLAWLLPDLLKPEAWATRDFTLGTRLLSEARIVTDYIGWTLLPTPSALSFYHDDFRVSTGLLAPWTTTLGIVALAGAVTLAGWLKSRRPLAALGIALFLGCHLLTGTILPLELIYEHRNYFASFGLLLAVVPLLAARDTAPGPRLSAANPAAIIQPRNSQDAEGNHLQRYTAHRPSLGSVWAAPLRHALLAGLMLYWAIFTTSTTYAWGEPLRLAEALAHRAPQSPRAQYELGRTYIIYSHYDPASPFTRLAYAPLEASAALPKSSILPEQALIFMNSRMGLPLKDAWWDSMIAKLRAHPPGVQDESSLSALTQCARERRCHLPTDRMQQAFTAALSHPRSSARLLATYGDYAWNVLDNHDLGERMTTLAVEATPDEPAYRITLIRMLAARGRSEQARQQLQALRQLNTGGRLDRDIAVLQASVDKPLRD